MEDEECSSSLKTNNNEDEDADLKNRWKHLKEQYGVLKEQYEEKYASNKKEDFEKKYSDLVDKLKEGVQIKEELEKKYIVSVDKLQEESKVKEQIVSKYNSLVSKLRDRIECPVCLEIPETGPVSACPNGHLVCSKCKSYSCPTCRSRMFEGKYLLAVTVLENIEHKCRNQGCGKVFPLAEIGEHKKLCDFRLTVCPAALCEQKIPFCYVIDHVMNCCQHSFAKKEKKVIEIVKSPYDQTFISTPDKDHFDVETFLWDGKYFFLNMKEGPAWTFNVEMLGKEEDCSEYEVELIVHRTDDSDVTNNKCVFKFTGTPCPVEEEKTLKSLTGLIINRKTMETKMLRMWEDQESDFGISVGIYKK